MFGLNVERFAQAKDMLETRPVPESHSPHAGFFRSSFPTILEPTTGYWRQGEHLF